MTSFLKQNLASAFGQGVQALNESVHTELRVGQHTVLVKERVAEGGFGFVDLVQEVNTKKEYVLKRCNVDRDEAFATVKKEINILQRFAGKYIVNLVDTDIVTKNRTSREALLLLDHCPGGHLLQRLNDRHGSHLPADTVYRIFGQLLLALKPMHESNPPITHRDLKLENILFGQDGKLKLIDFGSCVEGPIYMRNPREREAAEEIIAKETTQMYRAPEMCDTYMRQVLTEKTDIWALGCILYALCFLVHPFQDAGSLGILSAKIHFPTNSPFSEETHQLILKMLDVDPEARWDIKQLVEGTSALAGGRPLPDIPLSEEAIKRREERIAANTVRESKHKKAAPVAAPRKAVPLDSNSVAARRLAAKRGAPVGVNNAGNDFFDTGSAKVGSVSAVSPELDFAADFDSAPVQHQHIASATKSNAQASADLFDDFGSADFSDIQPSSSFTASSTVKRPSFGMDQPIVAATNKISDASALFDPVDEDEVEIVPAASSNNFSGGFDAFSDEPSASSGGFDAFGSTNNTVDAFGDHVVATNSAHQSDFEPSTSHDDFAPTKTQSHDAFTSRGSFTATKTSSGFDAFGASSYNLKAASADPFGSSEPIQPAAPPKKAPKPLPTAAAGPQPVPAFDLLGVSDDVIHPTISHSNHAPDDLFAASEMLTPVPALSHSSSHSNRNSLSLAGPPSFTDDLLIPEAIPASTSNSNRNSLSRDPNNVLSLFDMPKPEKPPKPVMLNTPPVMMMPQMGPPQGPGGMYGGGMMMPSPPRPGMMSPMGGPAGPSMMGGNGQFIPGPNQGPPQYGGGMMQSPQQMQQFGMPSPQYHHQQQLQQQQQQQQPSPMGGMNRGNTGMQQQPVFQTQKSIDPFDSINNFAPMKPAKR